MKDQEIDKLFKDSLLEKEITPSPRAWAALENQLDQQDRRRKLAFWWIPAAAAMLAGIGLGIHLYTAPAEPHTALAQKAATVVFTETPAIKSARVPSTTGTSSAISLQAPGSDKVAHNTGRRKPVAEPEMPQVANNGGKNPELLPRIPGIDTKHPVPIDAPDPMLEEVIASNTVVPANEEEIMVIIKMGTEAEAQQEGITEHRKTRAGRILAQLKNIKNGEQVDLKALGIDTSKLPFKRSAD